MIPSEVQRQVRDMVLQILQGPAAHDGPLVPRVVEQSGEDLARHRAQACRHRVSHQRCQRPIIIEEHCTPLRRSTTLEYCRQVLPQW